MDVDKLRKLVTEKKILRKENTKNLICKCIYCGDHSDPRKEGHLWVSKFVTTPVVHCFYCDIAKPINVFIKDLTGDKKLSLEIISKEELNEAAQRQTVKPQAVKKIKEFNVLPILDDSFKAKHQYIEKRSNNIKKALDFDNLIFDFIGFFSENNLTEKMEKMIGPYGIRSLQETFVGFITKNKSMLICRNIDPRSDFKFRKLVLQEPRFDLLDYVEFEGGDPDSNLVIMSEGTFDAIGEWAVNSLELFDKARVYTAGLSYSYDTLLKSICFDHQLFNVDVVILSDRNINPGLYQKLKRTNSHIIDSIRVYYNRNAGKDFGSFPIIPFELKLNPVRKYKNVNSKRSSRPYKKRKKKWS
jgi:hypothetical protein